jgi:uncharacterized protein (TIGR03435 family)
MSEILNHLWQSTAFAAIIAATAALLRRHSPRLRYWLWLAASIKFLIPFSLILTVGARIELPPDTPALRATTVQQISTILAPVTASIPSQSAQAPFPWFRFFAAFWIAGAAFFALRWLRRWWQLHLAARRASKLPLRHALPAYSSPAMIEPGVFGIFRPVLLLPEDLERHLSPEQFEAILAHESRHVQYRDNLTAALHMIVETLFWFHPLVWWIGARLVEERERDCDEAVLSQGNQPADYARGIVSVCQSYAASPLPCASGITGADLRKRIREIMRWRGSTPVSRRATAALAFAAVAAISLPFAIGILRAQSLPPAPQYLYDTVSVHRSAPDADNGFIGSGPQGGLRTEGTTVMRLLTYAWNVREYQIGGAPGWVTADQFDISFTPDKPDIQPLPGASVAAMQEHGERNRQRMQAVLRDRFGLILRAETHELPVYVLTLAKTGGKMTPHAAGSDPVSLRFNPRGNASASGATISLLTMSLSQTLGRPVIDETGLTGLYDFHLTWTPDPALSPAAPEGAPAASGNSASLFTAITDQLGLKMESKKGPVTVYVIEKLERPTGN